MAPSGRLSFDALAEPSPGARDDALWRRTDDLYSNTAPNDGYESLAEYLDSRRCDEWGSQPERRCGLREESEEGLASGSGHSLWK